MKKIFYFVFMSLMTLGIASCDDSDDNTPSKKSLSATPDKLSFTAAPKKAQTIAVKAENVRWEATTEAKWLTLDDAEGTADGTISVSADPNETSDPQTATIVIRAKGVDDVIVTVTQEAGEPAIIWERSSRSQMNFRGDVKTASTYGQYRENSFYSINDLEFDANGMLTAFTRDVSGTAIAYALTYDADRRLTKCAWTDSEGAKSFVLTYGNHGQYIHTENLFNDLSFMVGVTDFIIWLPRYIKNLETVVCTVPTYGDPSSSDVFTCSIEVTGATGKIYMIEGDSKTETAELAFANGFTSRSASLGMFGSTTDYTVNTTNGNLLQSSSDDGYSVVTVKYNDDRINSLAEVTGDISSKLTYNANLDVESVTDPSDGSASTVAYEYDAQGNWTKMTVTGALATVIDRSVTYYE